MRDTLDTPLGVITLTALGLDQYGPTGRFILFLFTAIVLAYLIFTLVNWVRTLTQLGRLGNTLNKIETAAEAVIDAHRAEPCMGAVTADMIGYITHIKAEIALARAVEAIPLEVDRQRLRQGRTRSSS